METGAITLLDVMGWKGIWQRNKNAQQALRELQENTRAVADLVTQGTVDVFEVFKGLNVRLQGISGTLAIYTYSDEPERAIAYHCSVAASTIVYAITKGLPLRGAISYGEFSVEVEEGSTMMVGPAIDEVAAWYEVGDWIGAILTPTGYFRFQNVAFPGLRPLVPYRVPVKNAAPFLSLCVDWVGTYNYKFTKEALLRHFLEMQAVVTPDIAGKFMNTIEFYDHVSGFVDNSHEGVSGL